MDAHALEGISRAILDAMPSLVLVVDDDVGIKDYNLAAARVMNAGPGAVIDIRGGDALGCIHVGDGPDGCGSGPSCETCVVRTSVNQAVEGRSVVRRNAKLELGADDSSVEIFAQVTASPFEFEGERLVLLVIEDIGELTKLRGMITICSHCRVVKDEEATWQRLEKYFGERWDMDFSHGLCPECFEREMRGVSR